MKSKFWVLLSFFLGAGAGYFAGVRRTKDKAEIEIEQREAEVRELYRADRRANRREEKKPEKKQPEPEKKTGLDARTILLSEKQEQAEKALVKYGAAFKEKALVKYSAYFKEKPREVEPEKKPAYVVDEFPMDSDYEEQELVLYADGVLARKEDGGVIPKDQIDGLVGRENLRLLEDDTVSEILVRNDVHKFDYTITYSLLDYSEGGESMYDL